MKIALASDLHLEFQGIELLNTEGADVLILSGDIMIAEDLHNHPAPDPYTPGAMSKYGASLRASILYRDFLKKCSEEFPHVVYVAGNHEFYHGKWNGALNDLREACAKHDNVHFLENDIFKLDDVVFIGGTLWTDCNKGDPLTMHSIIDMMNDFRIIRNDQYGYRKLSAQDTIVRHIRTKEYIKFIVSENKDKKCVVVGHHAPTFLSIHDDYKNDQLMNGAYASDLSEFILDHPQIKLWTHGHTHNIFDYMVGDTRVVCNPRGYAGHDRCADTFKLMFLDI